MIAAAPPARLAAILEMESMAAAHMLTLFAALITSTAAQADTSAMPPLRNASAAASSTHNWYARFYFCNHFTFIRLNQVLVVTVTQEVKMFGSRFIQVRRLRTICFCQFRVFNE